MGKSPKAKPAEIDYSEIRNFISLLLNEVYSSDSYLFEVFAHETLTRIIIAAEQNGYTGKGGLQAHFINQPSDKLTGLPLVDELFKYVEINEAIKIFKKSSQVFNPTKE